MLVGTQKLVAPENFRLYAEKKYKNGDFLITCLKGDAVRTAS